VICDRKTVKPVTSDVAISASDDVSIFGLNC
jgi:hypothetical protein